MSLTVSTIKFNVGGRMFEVNRSLLEHFPETLLAKLSQEQDGDDDGDGDGDDSNDSRRCNKKKSPSEDNDSILFIDRDSDRFACILNYMRDGEVDLPVNISKQSLLKDFAYYGFDSIDPNSIGSCYTVPDACSFLKQFEKMLTEMNNEIDSRKNTVENETANNILQLQRVLQETQDKINELQNTKVTRHNQLELKRQFNSLAYACFLEYTRTLSKTAVVDVYLGSSSLVIGFLNELELVPTNTDLLESFHEFGLKFLTVLSSTKTTDPTDRYGYGHVTGINCRVSFDVTNEAMALRPYARDVENDGGVLDKSQNGQITSS